MRFWSCSSASFLGPADGVSDTPEPKHRSSTQLQGVATGGAWWLNKPANIWSMLSPYFWTTNWTVLLCDWFIKAVGLTRPHPAILNEIMTHSCRAGYGVQSSASCQDFLPLIMFLVAISHPRLHQGLPSLFNQHSPRSNKVKHKEPLAAISNIKGSR